MKKKLVAIILLLALCISLIVSNALAYRDFTQPEQKASALKTLNLFQGVSENDFDLTRAPTRLEALVMFIRMIGAENDITNEYRYHSFKDVPQWANDYVAYAYYKGYTKGISDCEFGSYNTANAAMYLTFVLRALGYSDVIGGDFTWDNPFSLSRDTGILTDDVNTSSFLRADVVLASWNALFTPMKGGNKALADILIMDDVFTQEAFDNAVNAVQGNTNVDGIKIGKYVCYTDSYGYEYNSQYRPAITLYKNYTFELSSNTGEGMESCKGSWSTDVMDSGETAVYLFVDSANWRDSTHYSFIYYNNKLIISDGGIGITPVESEFKYETGSSGGTDPSPNPTPSPSPSPDSDNPEESDSGKKIPNDDKPTLDIKENILFDPISFARTHFGPIVEPVNPDETTQLLRQIKNGEKQIGYALYPNGEMTILYRYWGNRSQLEKSATAVLNHSDITPTWTKTQAISDFYANGGMLGTTVKATISTFVGNISFSNEESPAVNVPGANITMQITSVQRNFKIDKSLDLSNIATTDNKRYMAIDPENHVIVCYVYNDNASDVDWMTDCWVLLADVNSDGNLVLSGFFAQSLSTGMREFAKVNYTVKLS